MSREAVWISWMRSRRSASPSAQADGARPHTAHRGDRIDRPVGPHELEDWGGIKPVCRANHVAAIARISRTWRSRRFSRLSPPSSSGSALVSPSLRRPSLRSAWATQLRIARAKGFELPAQLLRGAPRSHQLDHLLPGRRRIRRTFLGRCGLLSSQLIRCPRKRGKSTPRLTGSVLPIPCQILRMTSYFVMLHYPNRALQDRIHLQQS